MLGRAVICRRALVARGPAARRGRMRLRRDRSGHRRDRQGRHAARARDRPGGEAHPAGGSSTARPPPTGPRRRSRSAGPGDRRAERVRARDRPRRPTRPTTSRPAPRTPRAAAAATTGRFRTGSPGLLPGFQETTAFSGLEAPTAVRFAPGRPRLRGREAGRDQGLRRPRRHHPDAPSPTCAPSVNHYWDRGLLGLALDPDFPAKPFVYVLYTHDAPIGGTAPHLERQVPDAARATTRRMRGRARGSRASRPRATRWSGREQVLIEDWCQQGPTHSIGDLRFGPDGALYVSAGDAASPDFVDYGQMGMPKNPCGDPPVRRRRRPDAADRRGRRAAQPGPAHARRSHHPRRHPPAREPGHRRGAARQPARRRAATRTPAGSSPTASATRSASPSGPARARSGSATWAGTRRRRSTAIADPPDATVENFGWPCYEGTCRQGGYDARRTSTSARTSTPPGGVTTPYLRLPPSRQGAPRGDRARSAPRRSPGWPSTRPAARCRRSSTARSSSRTTRAAASGSWSARGGAALPNPARVRTVPGRRAASPVDLQFGPGGDLFYADVWGGTIRRIHYTAGNQAPQAVARAPPPPAATRRCT